MPAALARRLLTVEGAMQVRIEDVSKHFGAFRALDQVRLAVRSGELLALLGPSGSGKSTLLRVLAGLEAPDEGTVELGGRDATHLTPRDRAVGFVFQHYALFRHMSVEKNVAFGLDVRHQPKAKTAERVRALLAMTGLAGLERRSPAQLSGGQRQRVALARALAPEPQLLLLDEPFAAVDARVREDLRQWLRRLHDEVPVTSIFVTHDQEEAFSIADRVAVMRDGRVEQVGTPAELIDAPATDFVARFVGEVNAVDGIVVDGAVAFGGSRVPAPGLPNGTAVRLTIRSHELSIHPAPASDAGDARVDRVVPLGDRTRIHATLDDGLPILVRVPGDDPRLADLTPGRRVRIDVNVARVWPRGASTALGS